jgi:hypothetical protein
VEGKDHLFLYIHFLTHLLILSSTNRMTVAHKTLRIGVDVGGTNTYVSSSLGQRKQADEVVTL